MLTESSLEKEATKVEYSTFCQKYILKIWNLSPEVANSLLKTLIKKDQTALWRSSVSDRLSTVVVEKQCTTLELSDLLLREPGRIHQRKIFTQFLALPFQLFSCCKQCFGFSQSSSLSDVFNFSLMCSSLYRSSEEGCIHKEQETSEKSVVVYPAARKGRKYSVSPTGIFALRYFSLRR